MKHALGLNAAVQDGTALGSYSAWLYSGFLGLDDDMNLALFTSTGFSPLNADHVNGLQAGIWFGMGYALPGGFSYTAPVQAMQNALLAAFGNDTEWAGLAPDGNNIFTGNISIMNLVTLGAQGQVTHHQDQLVYIPPRPSGNPPVVPEPMSFLVWSMLAMCVGVAKLRRRAD